MKKISKELLVQIFIDSVIKQTDSIMAGDARTGNKYAKKNTKCTKKLFEIGDEGKEELAKLFFHQNPDVRSMAAAYLLKYKTHEAMKVLKEVSKGKGFVAFGAQEAIKRWKEGNWHLDEF